MKSKLFLTLKGQWFDMELAGIKLEEYREIKVYWLKRLLDCNMPEEEKGDNSTVWDNVMFDLQNGHKWEDVRKSYSLVFKSYNTIRFTHGYAKSARAFEIECKGIRIGTGKSEWGGSGETFILSLGEIIKAYNI